jgi:ubiquinone/menaquinone biosynthesis C-methylase UbiE
VSDGIPTLLPDELRGGIEDERFRMRWETDPRLLDFGAHDPAGNPGSRTVEEMRREITKRDEESRVYDEIYPDELHVTERKDYDRLFTVRATDVLLDAGCGTGRLTKDYVGRCREIIGTDFSWESLRFFRDRLSPEDRERVHLVQADVARLPIRSASVDRLLCSGVLCFLPWKDRQTAAVSGMSAALKPGGVGAINVYHYNWVKRCKAALGFREANEKEGYHSDGSCHYINFTDVELRGVLSDWFQVRRIRGVYYRIPLLGRFRRLSDRLDGILGRIAFLAPILASELTAIVHAPRRVVGDPESGSRVAERAAVLE